MINKQERMEKLNNAGVNTGKYFSIDLPEGLKPGATISLVINEDGQAVLVNGKKDIIAEQIIEDGYVRNTKLHRRFVMAQMFQMLRYKSYNGCDKGYHACLNEMYSYQYTFDMMLEEIRILSRLETRDKESFEERSHFFTKSVVLDVALDYMDKLKAHVDNLPTKKCKGVPYKKIKGVNIFVDDLDKKLYIPLMNRIMCIRRAANYTCLYVHLRDFMRDMVKLPYKTPKSKVWVDAFKGEGAYYTLKNLIMYHNCCMYVGYGDMHKGTAAMDELKDKLNKYQGEGWRMFALMKKVISDNNFNFGKRMAEIYNK